MESSSNQQEDESIINKSFIETSYGKIRIRSVGKKTDPLFLIIHGSGPRNSGKSYSYFLHEYAIRFSNTWPLYMVAFDCPGYGESSGLKSAIRGFAQKFLSELIFALTAEKRAFILMGHSQGGNSLFTAVFENPEITSFVVAERPVIAEPKKFKDCKIPILFVYDEEDDGHPIKQGKEMTKFVRTFKFVSYKFSRKPYWQNDHLLEEVLKFLNEQQKFFFSAKACNKPNFELIAEVNGIEFKYNSVGEVIKNNYNKSDYVNNGRSAFKSDNSNLDKRSLSKNKDVNGNLINVNVNVNNNNNISRVIDAIEIKNVISNNMKDDICKVAKININNGNKIISKASPAKNNLSKAANTTVDNFNKNENKGYADIAQSKNKIKDLNNLKPKEAANKISSEQQKELSKEVKYNRLFYFIFTKN